MHHHKRGNGLTKEQIKAMRAVEDGADVYNRTIAVRLQEVKRNHPQFITIVKAVNPMQGPARPYFGAILTAAGIEAITPRKLRARASRIATIEARA